MLQFRKQPESPGDATIRERYLDAMETLFLPKEPQVPNIVQFVCSIIRAGGIEDADWDPFVESRGMIFDLFKLMKLEFTPEHFENPEITQWRLGLLFYAQVIETDAPYDVLVNLLRYKLNLGFSLAPFDDFLSKSELKQSKKLGVSLSQKIRIISQLGDNAALPVGSMFQDFYNRDLRNAIAHGDFIFTDSGIRVRGLGYKNSFSMTFEELDMVLNCSKIFFHVFYSLLEQARVVFGGMSHKFWEYDPVYKGIFEFLASDDGKLEGFKIHWPNGSDSYYRRSKNGNDCVNCILQLKPPGLVLMVGMYAMEAGSFSPLVNHGSEPNFTPIEKTRETPFWRES